MAALSYYTREAYDIWRDNGALVLLWRILVKLVAPLGELSMEILYERDLTDEIAPLPARANVTIREASAADIDAMLRLEGLPVVRDESGPEVVQSPAAAEAIEQAAFFRGLYKDRLDRGESCILGFVGSELTHTNWLCRQAGEAIPGYPIVLLPDEVYETDAFTAARWRRWGIHKFTHNEMLRRARAWGCRRVYTMANFARRRSRLGSLRLGYRLYGALLYFVPRGSEHIYIFRLRGRLDILLRGRNTEARRSENGS